MKNKLKFFLLMLAIVSASTLPSSRADGSGGVRGGGDAVAQDFVKMGWIICNQLSTAYPANASKIDLVALKKAIESVTIASTDSELRLLENGESLIKDAINDPSQNLITINRVRWAQNTEQQKGQLVLHEYLRFVGLDDSHYQISSNVVIALISKLGCSGTSCTLDSLKPYRDQFAKAIALNLTNFSDSEYYWINFDQNLEAQNLQTWLYGTVVAYGFYLNTSSLVPTFNVIPISDSMLPASSSTNACKASLRWADCFNTIPLYQRYFNTIGFNTVTIAPITQEGADQVSYPDPLQRLTLRQLGNFLVVKKEMRDNDGQWIENSYYWLNSSKSRLTY